MKTTYSGMLAVIKKGANATRKKLGYFQEGMEDKEGQIGVVDYLFYNTEKKDEHLVINFKDGTQWGYAVSEVDLYKKVNNKYTQKAV